MAKNFDSVFFTAGWPVPVTAFWSATKWVKFKNYCTGERISPLNMTPVVWKVSLLEISTILATPWPKISIRSFSPLGDLYQGLHFEVRWNVSDLQIFALERGCCSGTQRQWSRKYLSLKFQPCWPLHGQKFRFGLFYLRASGTRTWDCILMCYEMGQIYKFFPWGENFAPVHDASGLESIPPGNSIHFSRPWPKILIRSFWLMGDQYQGLHFEV